MYFASEAQKTTSLLHVPIPVEAQIDFALQAIWHGTEFHSTPLFSHLRVSHVWKVANIVVYMSSTDTETSAFQ